MLRRSSSHISLVIWGITVSSCQQKRGLFIDHDGAVYPDFNNTFLPINANGRDEDIHMTCHSVHVMLSFLYLSILFLTQEDKKKQEY